MKSKDIHYIIISGYNLDLNEFYITEPKGNSKGIRLSIENFKMEFILLVLLIKMKIKLFIK